MDRAATALLDPVDEAARRRAENEQVIAARFCPTTIACWKGCRATVTWAPDGLSYTCEHRNEQIGRYCGFNALEDEGISGEPIWLGTVRTASGTFAAQFEIGSEP